MAVDKPLTAWAEISPTPVACSRRTWAGCHSPGPGCAWGRLLGDDDAGGGGAGGQRGGGGGQFGQGAAGDGERADGADLAFVDVQVAAVGAEAGVDRAGAAGGADWRAARQGQRAVGGDLVAGDRAGSGVDGEQDLAVVADLHPAGGGLVVCERGGSDGGQRPVGGGAERRDRAGAGAVVGLGHKQLVRAGWAELAAERPQALGGER